MQKKPKKPKFDNSICGSCKWWYSLYPANEGCHFPGKRIYWGECIEYVPRDRKPSKEEMLAEEYERYQDEWN